MTDCTCRGRTRDHINLFGVGCILVKTKVLHLGYQEVELSFVALECISDQAD